MPDEQIIIRPNDGVVIVHEGVEIVEVGMVGPPGPAGAPGPPGAPGGSTYVHDQGAPSASWTVTHNLGRKPSITVVDSGDNVVHGDYQYIDDNTVVLLFSVPFGGKAYLN